MCPNPYVVEMNLMNSTWQVYVDEISLPCSDCVKWDAMHSMWDC